MITVIINGESRETTENQTLAELLKSLKLPSERIAVELNQTVVRRAAWNEIKIENKDQLEIVHFVGGGSGRFGF